MSRHEQCFGVVCPEGFSRLFLLWPLDWSLKVVRGRHGSSVGKSESSL